MGSSNEIIPSSAPEVSPMDEKIAVVTQDDTQDFRKGDLHIDDEAGDLAAQALASGPAEAEISKKVLRKIDLYILPFLCITYGESLLFSENNGTKAARSSIPRQNNFGIFQRIRNHSRQSPYWYGLFMGFVRHPFLNCFVC